MAPPSSPAEAPPTPWWERAAIFLLLAHRRPATRYWEVDALRGLAILLMVIYHFAFDLVWFGYARVALTSGFWLICARTSAILFLLLVGVALVLDDARRATRGRARPPYAPYFIRGLKVLGWGLVISLVSWAVVGRPGILFGILHLIGLSILLAYPFLRRLSFSAAAGLIVILVGVALNRMPAAHAGWLWLGWRPVALQQLDYFPLLPWFGVVLLGVAAGQWAYPGGVRRWPLPEWGGCAIVRLLVGLGQRSLLIYLVHQPFFFALLTLVGLLAPAP